MRTCIGWRFVDATLQAHYVDKERIEEVLRKLTRYADKLLKRVPQVIEMAHASAQLLQQGRHKAASAIEQLKRQLGVDAQLVKEAIYQRE